jgi:hypothetical protein
MMRLDPNQLNVDSFEIDGPGTIGVMANTEAYTCVTSAPCADSLKTCEPDCWAGITTHEN